MAGRIQGAMLGPSYPPEIGTGGLINKTNVFGAKIVISGPFWCLSVMIFGGSKGPNISPSMCHVMFNPLAALIKPLWGGKGCLWCNLTFVTKNWHFWAQHCHCWHFCSILVLIYGGGVKGSNRLSRMWHAIFNPFAALFNQFGATGSLYGQMWQFWALKQVFFETPCIF